MSGPRLHNLQHWKDWGANVTTNSGEVLTHCNVVFIGVKPGVLNEVVHNLINSFKPEPQKTVLFISMLVGITIEQLCKVRNGAKIRYTYLRISLPFSDHVWLPHVFYFQLLLSDG